MKKRIFKLQMVVFALVSASFANIYITQPILPVIQDEFGVSPVQVSMTVSVVILGIVLSNLFFGFLADRVSIHPIIFTGGLCVVAGGLICAYTHNFKILVAARLFQGIFIPALTTSLVAWLARTLPENRLSVVMGSYVSATVLGGLGGRLLSGWIYTLHWRHAFVSASVFILATTILALIVLPRTPVKQPASKSKDRSDSFLTLLLRRDLMLLYACGAGGLLIFSPIFTFLPYRLSAAPFFFSTELITLIYLVFVMGIFISPIAGSFSNQFGGGNTMIAGTCILGLSLVLLLIPSVVAVVCGLLGVCAGFFSIHAVAVGSLNHKLSGSHGKANALYVLFYYTGGWLGITGAGYAFQYAGWNGIIAFVICFLVIPFFTGIIEKRSDMSISKN